MKWTSAAFGVRFPDADGAAGPEAVDGAGDVPAPPLDALVQADVSADKLATATIVDRNPLCMRSLSAGHVCNALGSCEKRIPGPRAWKANHGGSATGTAERQLATETAERQRATGKLRNGNWPRHGHGMNTDGHRRATLGRSATSESTVPNAAIARAAGIHQHADTNNDETHE